MFNRALKSWTDGVALATAATILLAHQTSAQAHRRLEVAVTLGAYVPTSQLPLGPTNDFALPVCVGVGPQDIQDTGGCPPFTESQRLAAAVGGRVTAWLGNRGAIEGSFWYAPSGVTGFYPASGNIAMGTLRFVLSVAPQAPTVSPLLTAGPAVIHRSGDAYANVRGTLSPGAAVGIGLDIHPGRHFAFRAQIEDYLYDVKFASGTGPGVGEWKFQHDVVLSLSTSLVGQRGERR